MNDLSTSTDPSPEAIKQALEKILSSPGFVNSKKLCLFLRYLVTKKLTGQEGDLKGYTIALDVFGKSPAFDPQADSIVRVQAGKMRRRLEHYYLDQGRDDPVHIGFQKGSYIPIFQWNSKRAKDEARPKQDIGDELAGKASIAVLPFNNMSGDPEQEYFSDGISEEIITGLTRFREMRVLARHTSFQYKGRPIDIRKLGREWHVQYILEGSIRRSAKKVRVTAQLIDAVSGTHLWADTYNCSLSPHNILDVQDTISEQIIARIAHPYGVISRSSEKKAKRRGTHSQDAYDCVLQSYNYIAAPSPEAHLKVRDALEGAVQIDSDYSDAWAILSWVYGDEYRFEYNPRPHLDNPLDRALKAAKQAVALDPDSAIAWQSLSVTYFLMKEMDRFKDAGERALSLNPCNPHVVANVGFYLAYSGEWEKGKTLMKKAMALSPHHPNWYYYPFIEDHYLKGEFAKALSYAMKLNTPDFFWMHGMLAMIYGQLGCFKEAEAALNKLLALYPDFPKHVRREIQKWHFSEDNIEKLLSGFYKAGLEGKGRIF